jgi:hypothetical protein
LTFVPRTQVLSLEGDFDIDSGLERETSNDGVERLHRAVEVDEALVDAHLEPVEGVGTVTARGLAGGDNEGLGGKADRALDVADAGTLLGPADEVRASLLESGNGLAREGHADAAHLRGGDLGLSNRLRHLDC